MSTITIAEIIAQKKIQLAEIQAAISATLKHQVYDLEDGQGKQSVERPKLSVLKDMEADILNEIVTLESGGIQATQGRPL